MSGLEPEGTGRRREMHIKSKFICLEEIKRNMAEQNKTLRTVEPQAAGRKRGGGDNNAGRLINIH